MPTVYSDQGFQIKIYTQDHLPPHVHIQARGCEAIFYLNCTGSEVMLRKNYRFKSKDLNSIKQIVQAQRADLCRAWEEIHDELG